jgi:drug/metabolite transporter (DMT)-like permease
MTTVGYQALAWMRERFRASGTPGKRNDPVAALLWMTIGVVGLSGLSGFAKYAGQQGVEPLLIAFYRNVFCFLCLTPLLYLRGPSIMRSGNFSLYGVRVGFQLLSMLCWFPAMTMIPLADLQATSFLAPLFATILAIVYLHERVPVQRWLALAVGMFGAFIILRPLAPTFGLGQVLALVAAMAIGVGAPLIKQLTATDDADKIVFLTNAILIPTSLIPALFVWHWPPAHVWPYLVGMGMCACLGHVAMTRAYSFADASLVATFDFARLPFAVLIGLYFFNEKTDVWTWIGSIIIFAAAFYITHSERQEKKRSAASNGRQVNRVNASTRP